MVQTYTELTVMLICTAQYFNSAVNILGVKCDKVVDFPKSGHNYAYDVLHHYIIVLEIYRISYT